MIGKYIFNVYSIFVESIATSNTTNSLKEVFIYLSI